MHLVSIQSGDVNRENTFPNRNRIHPKYVCTCTRENSRSPRSSIFNPDCVCRPSNLPLRILVTQCSQPSSSTSHSILFSLSLSLSPHARIFAHARLSGHAAYRLGWSKVYCPCGLKSPCENFARSPLPNPPLNWT